MRSGYSPMTGAAGL